MTLPTLLLAGTLATLFGAGFHLWQGGSSRRFALYLLAGWLGFALGHWLGNLLGIRLIMIGALNVASAALGSTVALFTARWLATSDAVRAEEN